MKLKPSKNLQEHGEICDQANLEEDHGSHEPNIVCLQRSHDI